jgi:hypothetical protein
MTIRLKYSNAVEPEDVAPGDILIDREDRVIEYVVIDEDPSSEEFICIRVGEEGPVKKLLFRIGFEEIEDYIKAYIER